MSSWRREGARWRRGLLALLAGLLGLGVLLMHTQLVDASPAGSAASTPAGGPHHGAVMPTPNGSESLIDDGDTTAAPTAVASSAGLSASVATSLPVPPQMPAAPSMPGMHATGMCVAVLGSAVGLLLLVGLLLGAADSAGTSRWLAALVGSSRLSRPTTRRAPWRRAKTPTELCLLRT